MMTSNWTQQPWDALLRYSEAIQKVVRSWRSFMESDFTPDHFMPEDISSWLSRFEHSMLALRDLHVYDGMRTMRICPAGSGLPERLHIRMLETMRKEGSVNDRALRQAWIDQLFEHKVISHGLLERIAKNVARSRIERYGTLKLFGINRLQRLSTENGKPTYLCCFERYCRKHRSSLYVIVFESSDDPMDSELLKELSFVLREESTSMPRLETMARHIDQAIAMIHPVWLGRISLGPVFVSNVTQDEHELQRTLDESAESGEYLAASRFIYEYLLAESAKPVQTLLDPKGRKHTSLQKFAVRKLNEECNERGITELQKHLFAPHHIVRALPEEFRRSIGHRITIVEK